MLKYIYLAMVTVVSPAFCQVGNPAVTTGQYNNARTGANTAEVLLNKANVNQNQFGKLFSLALDGWIFAQPLYVPGVIINGVSTNVVYVATMHNSIYAFSADNPGFGPIWKVTLGNSVTAPTSNGCPSANFTGPELGILGTPVIDPSAQTLYAVAATPSGGGYVHTLHALDITTGAERAGSPVAIQPSISGTGYDNQSGKVSLSTQSTVVQRTALLLANGSVYAGFGNCGPDNGKWHGWIVGYSTSNLQNMSAVFNSTPNGGEGGIWQSGRGPVSDANGDLYFTTGNATASGAGTGSSSGDQAKSDYPMSLLQLNTAGNVLASYPPTNYTALNTYDLDFSSSGPLLIPGTNYLVAGGKDGILYLFGTGNLAAPLQSLQATGTAACSYSTNSCLQIHDLDFWNSTLYLWGARDVLKAYTFSSGKFATTASSQNAIQTGYHPAAMAISANSSADGILWATTADNTLHAIDAGNVAVELWNSNQNSSRDALPSYARFVQPTVTNGRVYVATASNQVAVYGLLSDFTLASSVSSQPVYQGNSSAFTINATTLGGSNGAVNFTTSGLPSGATAVFSPASITGSGATTVTITTASSTPTGTYNVIVTGTSGGVTRTASVSLVVTTPDTTAPQWTCCTYTASGSSYVMGFSASDTQSGLKSLQAIQQVNATVAIPSFQAGTTSPVNFSSTQSGWSSYVKFQLTDEAGNISYIDPAAVDVSREKGPPVPFALKGISPGEGFVTILNGSPSVKNLRIEVNLGAKTSKAEVAGLRDGETREVNINSLLPNFETTVAVTPLGKPGGTAFVVLSTAPNTGK